MTSTSVSCILNIFIWVLRTVQWRIYHLIFQDAAITSNTFLLITISSSIFKDNATSMHIILDSSKWDSKGKAAWKWNTKCLNKGAAVQCTSQSAAALLATHALPCVSCECLPLQLQVRILVKIPSTVGGSPSTSQLWSLSDITLNHDGQSPSKPSSDSPGPRAKKCVNQIHQLSRDKQGSWEPTSRAPGVHQQRGATEPPIQQGGPLQPLLICLSSCQQEQGSILWLCRVWTV